MMKKKSLAEEKNKGGRPKKAPGESIISPVRVFGRVSAADWKELQDAAKRVGKSFTKWALDHLLKIARRGR